MSSTRRKQFNYVVDAESVTVQRLGYEGEEVKVLEQEVFVIADIPASLVAGEGTMSLAAYGLSQILQDRTSSIKDSEERFGAMPDVFELLKSGEWKAARESTAGPRKAAIDSFFAKGFAMYLESQGKDVTPEAAVVVLQDMTAEQRKAVRSHEAIAGFIKKAKEDAAAAAAEIDVESLFS